MKPGWLVLVALVCGLLTGGIGGWSLRVSATGDRYIRSLAEQHEAAKRYWDTHTNNIITNNTLEAKRREKR